MPPYAAGNLHPKSLAEGFPDIPYSPDPRRSQDWKKENGPNTVVHRLVRECLWPSPRRIRLFFRYCTKKTDHGVFLFVNFSSQEIPLVLLIGVNSYLTNSWEKIAQFLLRITLFGNWVIYLEQPPFFTATILFGKPPEFSWICQEKKKLCYFQELVPLSVASLCSLSNITLPLP